MYLQTFLAHIIEYNCLLVFCLFDCLFVCLLFALFFWEWIHVNHVIDVTIMVFLCDFFVLFRLIGINFYPGSYYNRPILCMPKYFFMYPTITTHSRIPWSQTLICRFHGYFEVNIRSTCSSFKLHLSRTTRILWYIFRNKFHNEVWKPFLFRFMQTGIPLLGFSHLSEFLYVSLKHFYVLVSLRNELPSLFE